MKTAARWMVVVPVALQREGLGQVIARLYPADRATGYRDGDLRGGLWVEVPSRPGQ